MATVQQMRNVAGLCITTTRTALGKLTPPLIAMAQTGIRHRKRHNQPRVFQQKPKAYPNDNEAKESIKLIDIED